MIGGGTGSFTLLSALKNYANDVTAIVNMVDDGGSTGALRDELGVLPPGDVRQCLVALSESSQTVRELFNYRFPQGTFAGHAFGNLFLTALEKITGSFGKAVEEAGKVLKIRGRVVPVTLDDTRLVLKQGRRVLKGERVITQSWFRGKQRPHLSLQPDARINPEAKAAIKRADMVVIAPGNLYSSLIPTLLVKGIKSALKTSKAKVIYVSNLVTKPGQTDGFKVDDFIAELERYAGAGIIDYVIYNNRRPSQRLLKRYAKAGEDWVEFDSDQAAGKGYQEIAANLVSSQLPKYDQTDRLAAQRAFIRHDGDKVAKLLMKLHFS
jgi:uncharacterized cofD-like protein